MRPTWRVGAGPLVVAALAFAVFAAAAPNGFVWDDVHLVARNPHLGSLSGLAEIFRRDLWSASALGTKSEFYRPLALASFAIDRALGGNRAIAFHLGNAALHAANAALVALLLGRWLPTRPRLALGGAALFALAPAHSEATLWISGRFDLLAATFALAAAYAASRARHALVVVALGAALLCKEASAFVALLVLAQLVAIERAPRRAVAGVAGGLAFAFVAYLAARRAVGVETAGALDGLGPTELVRAYAFLVATTARLLVAPFGLDAFHPYEPLGLVPSVAIVLGVGAATLGAAYRARRDGDRAFALVAFGLVWFSVSVGPPAITGPVLDMTGDRYAYLPDVGLFVAATALASRYSAHSRAVHLRAWAAFATWLVADAGIVVARARDFRDERSFYAASLRAHPGNPYALYALGEIEAIAGDLAAAEPLLERAVATAPKPWRPLTSLCFVRLRQGRLGEAEDLCRRAIAINGSAAYAWTNLAAAYASAGAWTDALDAAREAARHRTRGAEATYLEGLALANLGDLAAAADACARALAVDPSHRGARSLAAQLAARGVRSPR